MDQHFTTKKLLRFLTKDDLIKNHLKKDDLIPHLDNAIANIINGDFQFKIKKVHDYFCTEDIVDVLILRKLNYHLKTIYKEQQANRRIIISQVKTLLEDKCEMHILRTDIKSFYSSIRREILLLKLKSDAMLSYFSLKLINVLFNHSELENEKGLPWGISISSTLSEIYMRGFDKWIRSLSHIYYYARFVDDIIIFSCNKEQLQKACANINHNLEPGLIKNEIKTKIFDGSSILSPDCLEFLGYSFSCCTIKKNKPLTISIAEDKIKKIKTRIILSLIAYIKDGNFFLLKKRIKFLTGNYTVKIDHDGSHLKAGIFYNYSLVSDENVFKSLNLFLRKSINSRTGSLGGKLRDKLTFNQQKILSKECFERGFDQKTFHAFGTNDFKKIRTCWQ